MLFLITTPYILLSLLSVAYLTLFDRKFMAAAQRRLGPSIVGPKGVAQPLTDGGKLFGKQSILLKNSNSVLFQLAPVLLFAISLFIPTLLPILSTLNSGNIISISQISLTENASLIFIILSLSVSTFIFLSAGWASFSKYAELGGVRGANQALGYELILTFVILILIMFVRSLDLGSIALQQLCSPLQALYLHFDLLYIFWISILAETARVPFDLPESESELVAGYFTEYAGFLFALFFLAEYNNMLFNSLFFSIVFFAGWVTTPFNFFFYYSVNYVFIFFSIFLLLVLFSLHRSVLARVRMDQLYYLNWKIYMPWLSISFFYSLLFLTFFQLFDFDLINNVIISLDLTNFGILITSTIFFNNSSKHKNNNKRTISTIASLSPEILETLNHAFQTLPAIEFYELLEKYNLKHSDYISYFKNEKVTQTIANNSTLFWSWTGIVTLFAISNGVLLFKINAWINAQRAADNDFPDDWSDAILFLLNLIF